MKCVICKIEVPDYEPEYCCSGMQCGCMGAPIEPCVCRKKECLDKVFGGETVESENDIKPY